MPSSRLKQYRGPALFSYGFRPFFLFGSLYAGVAILLWLPVFYSYLGVATSFAPRDWHIHEMLFGYVAAVIAGFLLTAIPNWTGRLPLQGRPLMILFAVWVAGRVAVGLSAWIGWGAAALIDSAFLLLLAAAAAREIIAGRKWSNLTVVVIVGVLAAANVAFHVEAHLIGLAEYATRAGIAVVMMLISLIGGRIIPSFTRNWLAKRAPGRLPVPFGRFDSVTLALSAVALAGWVVRPLDPAIGVALLIVGALHIARLARWTGYRTSPDRLVLILHLAYAFVPLGFVLNALSAWDLVVPSAGIHAWTGGAVGTMTLAVMTRATLGHTGQPLRASLATHLVYASVVIAALSRVSAVLQPEQSGLWLAIAGAAWAIAFTGFAAAYGPALCRRTN